MAQHTVAPPSPPVLAAMRCPAIATWPYFSPGPVMITYDSTGHPPNTGAAQSNLSPFAVHTLGEEGRKSTRGGGNNSVAAAAHPPSQCRQNRSHTITHTKRNNKTCARSRSPTQHSDNDPHKKPHKHLPTSAQEPQPNTNTEPKHIVESLLFSLWPDFFCAVKPASAASLLYFVFSIPPFSPLETRFKGEIKTSAVRGLFSDLCLIKCFSISPRSAI